MNSPECSTIQPWPVNIVPSVESRYTAANDEKSGRIQARQLVQITFAAMLSGLITVLSSGGLTISEIGDFQALVLSVGPPMLGLIAASWVGHQDLLVGLLDSYCHALEQYGRKSLQNPLEVPCW